MTIKTTLSFTERHHGYLKAKVEAGVFATQSAAVAAAVERLIEDEVAQDAALEAMAATIRARMATPETAFVEEGDLFAAARARVRLGEKD